MNLEKLTVTDCVVYDFCYGKTEVPRSYMFVDFDGTIRNSVDNSNPAPGYAETYDRRPPLSVDEVEVFPVVVNKLTEWSNAGYRIIGITNQSGVEEGGMSLATCISICKETVRQTEIFFPVIFAPCKTVNPDIINLRKPNVGMIELTEKLFGPVERSRSLLVGDYKTDIEMGQRAGLKTYKVDSSLLGKDFPEPKDMPWHSH